MDKGAMLESLINHYTDGNKAKFSHLIGVKPQTVSAWIARDTFDAELLYAKCEDISAEWLLSGGNGEMIKKQNVDTQSTAINGELIKLCTLLVENYQQRDEVMNKLVSIVRKM